MPLLPSATHAAESYLAAVSAAYKIAERIESEELTYYGAVAVYSALGFELARERVKAALVRSVFRAHPDSVSPELRDEILTAEEMAFAMLGRPLSDDGWSKQICS